MIKEQSIPSIIPPGSIVRLVKADKTTPEWKNMVGTSFRVGYYYPQDGSETIWLVDAAGNYCQTVDRDALLKYFEIIKLSKRRDFYGIRSKPFGSLVLGRKPISMAPEGHLNREQKMEMYPYAYIYRGRRTVLIWQTKDTDTFQKDCNAHLLQSGTLSSMKRKLRADATKIHWSEYSEMDFDKFWTAMKNLRVGRASSIKTCAILLEGWNFIEDMGRTFNLKREFKGLHTKTLSKSYQKLYQGNNLLAPEGRLYSPLWRPEEIRILRFEFSTIWTTLRKQGYIRQ
jgi:hypothetical protein